MQLQHIKTVVVSKSPGLVKFAVRLAAPGFRELTLLEIQARAVL